MLFSNSTRIDLSSSTQQLDQSVSTIFGFGDINCQTICCSYFRSTKRDVATLNSVAQKMVSENVLKGLSITGAPFPSEFHG
jgi:hypothetical protein